MAAVIVRMGLTKKQELLKQTVSEKGIAMQWIGRWDGHLPQIIAGDKGGFLMQIPNVKEEK